MTKRIIILFTAALLLVSCGIYSLSGTSIQPDVNSITINYIEYKAPRVNPTLSNDLTEGLRNQFRRMTRLEQVEMDGDLVISGEVVGYAVAAAAISAQEVASRNKLTVTVKIDFTNRKHSEDDFQGKTFSNYAEYDATQSLDSVESSLTAEIIEKIIEDIFNATVAQW